jgi:radical SAM protein with 4Fe4S-binding SPASM domain
VFGRKMLITKHYPEEHYSTLFNTRTGFFVRIEDSGHKEPFWSKHGPELLDISITSWCDRNCQVCYRDAGIDGKHLDIQDYEKILRQSAKAGVMQIALGGGNPNQHPEFLQILELTRKKFGIVPNYTTNGRGLSSRIIKASAELCGAVAVSAYEPYEELWDAVTKLVSAGVKTNIHFVLDAISIDTAILWLKNPPTILNTVNAIVFLNYKPIGRKPTYTSLLRNSNKLQDFFDLIENKQYPFRIGFDSCMASSIASYTKINPVMYDTCESGRFSMYISENMLMYPCSFMDGLESGVSLRETDIVTAWQNSDIFCKFRESQIPERCKGCSHTEVCLGGCRLFEDINICL